MSLHVAPYEPEQQAEILSEVCQRLAKGEPLAQICREEGKPDPATIWRWTEKDQEAAQAIARAREAGFDQIALDALNIADDGENDTYEDKDGFVRTNNDVVQRARLRVETRLKLLAKWDPKRYGDKIQTEHSGKVSVNWGLPLPPLES